MANGCWLPYILAPGFHFRLLVRHQNSCADSHGLLEDLRRAPQTFFHESTLIDQINKTSPENAKNAYITFLHVFGGSATGLYCGLSDGFGASANFHVNVKKPNLAFASNGSFVSLPDSFTVLLSAMEQECNLDFRLLTKVQARQQ